MAKPVTPVGVSRLALEPLEPRRLLAGVSIDPSFAAARGGHAVVDAAANAASKNDFATAILQQSDGKTVVTGTLNFGTSPAQSGVVSRLNADGTRDTGFGTAGSVVLGNATSTIVSATRLLADGKILVAGNVLDQGSFVTRLNADGSPDTAFGANGTARFNYALIGTIRDFIVLPDGKLLLGGSKFNTPSTYTSGSYDNYATVARLNADGTVDTAFGTDGRVMTNQISTNQGITSLTQLSPTVVIAGTPPSNGLVGVVTINPQAGTVSLPDPLLGDNSNYSPRFRVNDIVALPDGGAAAAGMASQGDYGLGVPALVRLTATGALDTAAFANGITQLLPNATGAYLRQATALTRLDDGALAVWVTGGDFTGSGGPTALRKVSPAGVIDATFNGTGGYATPSGEKLTGTTNDPVTDAVLDAQGRMLMVFNSTAYTDAGTLAGGKIVVSRFVLDMGLTPRIDATPAALVQGRRFTVSSAGTVAGKLPVVKVEWDGDYAPGVFDVDATGVSASLRAQRAPSQKVAVRLTTSDGASAIFTETLTVQNAPPTVAVSAASGLVTQVIPLAVGVTDPGLDTFELKIDPGNGSAVKTYANWTPTTPVTVAYAAAGTYAVKATVTDAGGLSTTAVVPVTVSPLGGRVVDAATGTGLTGVAVFVDTDRDGVRDTGEAAVVSDAGGAYTLPPLPNGSYQLGVVPPTDYFFAGSVASDLQFLLPTSAVFTAGTIRLARETSVSGVVYNDDNKDGIADAPPFPVAGATVWLDLNDDAAVTAGEPTSVTAGAGTYKLVAPGGGTYKVRVLNTPAFDATASAPQTVTLGQHQRAGGVLLTVRRKPANATLNVIAYHDANGNGVRETSEAYVGGATGHVTFGGYADATAFTTFPGAANTFANLPSGNVTVSLDALPAGYTASVANGTDPVTVNLLDYIPRTVAFGLKYDQPFATVRGRAFVDANGNGTYETSENAAATTVYFDRNDNGVLDADEPAALTNSSTGQYTLDRVPPGGAKLRLVVPNGYAYPANAAGRVVVAQPNETVTNVDFGLTVVPATPTPYVAMITGPSTITEGQNGYFGGSGSAHGVPITGFEWDFDYTPGGPFTVDATGYATPFGNALEAPRTVTLAGRSVDANGRRSDVATFTLTVVPSWLSVSPGAAYTLAGNTLGVTAGVVTLTAGAGDLAVAVSGSGQLVCGATQHFRSLSVRDDARVTLTAGGKVLRVGELHIDPTARLDLADNALVIDYAAASPLATIAALVVSGRAGGTWAGGGLISSIAKTRTTGGQATLGVMEAADYRAIYGNAAAFAGETLDGPAVLVKYTLAGDSDFDGKTDFNDFVRLQSRFGQHAAAGSVHGDFDLDGDTDFDDFVLIQANFGRTL